MMTAKSLIRFVLQPLPRVICLVICFAACLAASAQEAVQIRWENDFGTAVVLAEKSQRLLYIHFYGNNCSPADQMATEVFTNRDVIAGINANFVPIRINASEQVDIAKKFNVEAIPADLVLKPNGQLVHKRQGGISAERFIQYLAFLQNSVQTEKAAVPQVSAVPPPPVAVSTDTALYDPFTQQTVPQPPVPQTSQSYVAPTVNPVRTAEPAPESFPPKSRIEYTKKEPVKEAVPALNNDESAKPKMTVEVPLALEGFCPVTLTVEERWVPGNPAFYTFFRGHIFRFASEESLNEFSNNPARYVPIAMGEDIVQMVDRNKRVIGNRKHGVYYEGRVYLFANQESLDAFAAKPQYYAEIAMKYETARKDQRIPLTF
jgi:YHS domain-containing protein/thioredoxin-related protein